MPHPLGKLQIHDETYCPEEIYGALDMEDGKVRGVHVCTVEGDDPLPIAQEIVARWNAHDELLAACELALARIESDIESDRFTVREGDTLREAIAKAKRR